MWDDLLQGNSDHLDIFWELCLFRDIYAQQCQYLVKGVFFAPFFCFNSSIWTVHQPDSSQTVRYLIVNTPNHPIIPLMQRVRQVFGTTQPWNWTHHLPLSGNFQCSTLFLNFLKHFCSNDADRYLQPDTLLLRPFWRKQYFIKYLLFFWVLF